MAKKGEYKKIPQMKVGNYAEMKEKVEDFLHSDSFPATATKFILMFLATSSIVFGGALLVGLCKALKSFNELNDREEKFSQKTIKSALTNITRQKLVEILEEKDGKIKISLNDKGKKRIREYLLEDLKIGVPKKWDGKWRVLIFDIPTKPKIYNQAREALRGKIKELGFYQIQKSVWVFPYECEDELLFIAEIFGVQKYIEILTVEELLNGRKLKQIFKL